MTAMIPSARTWRVLPDDGERYPPANLAREEALARLAGSTPTLRLWRNARSVIVGRSQVAAAEVDEAAARELGVPVYRRFTAGGAVFQDAGNLNATVVARRDALGGTARRTLARLPELYRLVLEPLASAARALGVSAIATERDILVDGRKIGGIAAWIGGAAVLVHGTLLVDADLETLERVLAGPGAPGDPRWERTKSRRMAVTSLARERPRDGLDAAAVEAAVLGSFGADRGSIAPLTEPEIQMTDRLLDERYARTAWHATGNP